MAGSVWVSIVQTHLDPVVDSHFGEPVVVTPMRSTANGRRTVDPDRMEIRCVGVFTRRPHRPGLQIGNRAAAGRGGNDLRSLVQSDMPRVSLPTSAFDDEILPRQGDRVEVAGERFEVVSVRYDGVSRHVLNLVAVGG